MILLSESSPPKYRLLHATFPKKVCILHKNRILKWEIWTTLLMMTIVFFFIRIHQFTLFSRRHPFIQDTTKKTNSVCCVQFKNNNECTYHVWRLLVSHHCLPSNNVPSSFVLCDENTIWWTFFTNVWIWGHTGKVLELKRLDHVILEDAFLGQRFNSDHYSSEIFKYLKFHRVYGQWNFSR